MSVLLAIDTSIGTSVALGVDDRIHALVSADPRGHTEVIGDMIADVFKASGADPGRVDGVVVGIGPGPFTGLRVGIAAAKAFATGRGVPLLPLLGHEAAAFPLLREAPEARRLRVLQDAKRRELFVTEYTGLDEQGLPVRSADPRLLAHSDYAEEPGDLWPNSIPADGLVRLAARRLELGRGFEADRAVYLRNPDVYPAAAPKRVSV